MVTIFTSVEKKSHGFQNLTIYGRPLNWHAVKEELADTSIIPCNRKSSVFREQDGLTLREIVASATDTKVRLAPKDGTYIYFEAEIIKTDEGFTMLHYDAQLKYPPTADPYLNGKSYPGMPRFSELTPSVKAYFTSLGHQIDGIYSEWLPETPDYRSDNYRMYTLAKGSGPHNPHIARDETIAGKNAQNLGYTGEVRIRDGKLLGRRRDYPCIIAEFFRPGISLKKTS